MQLSSPPTDAALVVLSGGQDSTTCLYWAKQHFEYVEAVSFDYGQRHRIELECAQRIANMARTPLHQLPINTFSALGGNALTDPTISPLRPNLSASALPNTFVPGRNLIFLTFAASLAYKLGIHHLVTGVAQTDYSGYPDCHETTLQALELAINLGMESRIRIHAPLMFMSKADSVRLAQQVGALEALAFSHTCYEGEQPPCGVCAACVLREKGFTEAGLPDPLLQRFSSIPS